MDGDWEEVSRLLLPPPIHGAHSPIRGLAFDTHQELLWLGNDYGRVSSFCNAADPQAYTSFVAGDGPVAQIIFHRKGVIALTPTSVHMALRRGQPMWHIAHEEMKDLRCMSFTTARGTSDILVAGAQNLMFVIDVEKGTIKKQIPATSHYSLMKRSRYICAATLQGDVHVLDPTTFNLLKSWPAHSAAVHDMDAQHDFIVTCGYSRRHLQANYMLDPLVNVFNLKTLESFNPISFPAGAAFVRMHPKMSSTMMIVSQIGQMQVVDLMNVNTSTNMRQAAVMQYIQGLEIATSGEALVMTDSECQAQIWGSRAKLRFTDLNMPIEIADAEDQTHQLDWSADTPLSTVGIPYYRETLLSAWPSHMIFEIGAPPPAIESSFVSSLKTIGGYTSTPNISHTRRNQVENTRITTKVASSIQAPMFLSDKENAKLKQSGDISERRISDVANATNMDSAALKAEVPDVYRNVEIKYSRFGIDDFDFGYYNKTEFSGLETHIANSYANALLQLMRFTPLIRNLALQHTATACISDLCLLCEMGFLVDMLEKANGTACQATNMLKTLGYHPPAKNLGLLEEDAPMGSTLTSMLQKLNQFLLDRFSADFKSMLPNSSAFDQLFATSATTSIKCEFCRTEQTRPGTTLVNELTYPPPKLVQRNARQAKLTFSQILKLSIERETTSRGWCSRCMKYQPLNTTKRIHSAPVVLMLNAAANSPEAKQFWGTPGWLPEEIGIIIDKQQFYCYEGEGLEHHLQRGAYNIAVYSLVGIAADIDSGRHEKPHLVSFVNVSHSRSEVPGTSQWHLFNDFLVRPIKAQDALTFNTAWKLPSVITYQLKSHCNSIDDSWKQIMDRDLLYRDTNTRSSPRTYRPLTANLETPDSTTIVALDTEFVSVKQPQIQMHSDGVRETIRPTVHALARVSVVRTVGEDEGLPFIDDYITVRDKVFDYLTNFSGIVASDLDVRTSTHNLVSLKVAYKKLWILLNLGCKFLGHSMKTDFRVVNIHIPKAQRIDTAELFWIKEQRRTLSLSFLAYLVLKEDIQVGTHDSIEDSRTALKLYKKHQEFTDAGILRSILNDIYGRGKELGFKVPVKRVKGMETPGPSPTPTLVALGEVDVSAGAGSGPVTPVRRPLGLVPGTGGSFGGGFTPGSGSPFA
ncbi:PAB-dependent poly(A)-specific ribonuclease subunit PAN2 [Calycina marina]|uniref:PAN2-PAN3 deadenylation complex catalytic subunit PAN2 n=1 Tax=Calycina marina TaxID=1763456 RepID=A0A9P7YYP0_9HELO|nr:PAB-dependent poly(A)-specific ribonuclease subunit PAN2 [Calycina marina]